MRPRSFGDSFLRERRREIQAKGEGGFSTIREKKGRRGRNEGMRKTCVGVNRFE